MYDDIKQRRVVRHETQKEVATEKDDGCKEVADEKLKGCSLNEMGAEGSSFVGKPTYGSELQTTEPEEIDVDDPMKAGGINRNGQYGSYKKDTITTCPDQLPVSECSSVVPAVISKGGSSLKKDLRVCGDCGKTFASWRTLKNHMKIHTRIKPFSCPWCNYHFGRKDHLLNHQRNAVNLCCDKCKKHFCSVRMLRKHVLEQHDQKETTYLDADNCMQDKSDIREDSDHNEHVSDSKSEHRNILSYGISIDTSKIETVSRENQGSELEHLNVDVYEHDQFEKGIINQVDTALATAETNFKKNIIGKKIEEIESEIRLVETDKADIDKIFLAAKHDASAAKKISFSLVQQSRKKEEYLKKLKQKLSDARQEEVNLECSKEADEKDKGETDVSESIRLGEITPFDALAQQNKGIIVPRIIVSSKSKKKKFNEGTVEADPDDSDDFDADLDYEDDEKRNRLTVPSHPKKKKINDSSTAVGADPDYDISVESYSDDLDSDPDCDVAKKRESKANEKSKYLLSRKVKPKKTIDDGNFNCFKERMQKLKARKKLREACKRGEVAEEYHSSDFSSSDDSDDDVNVQDQFVLPKRIWDKLYKYQRVCVKWLWQLHCQDVGGIVGDEMGLGKTIEMIAFLIGLDYSKKAKVADKQKYGLGPVLIVCPASVLHHWVAELHKWWPKFRVAILHSSGTFVGKLETLIKAINNHPGILVTTYGFVSLNEKALMRYYWNYVILDEGHKIRNPASKCTLACKQFDTPHRIILTGTPMQNNLKELWTIFDFVFPGRLGTLPVFTTEFSGPIMQGGYATASPVQVQTACRCATILRDTISPYILRRFKKDVKQINLPEKSEQVLFCKLTDLQTRMYKDYLRSHEVQMMMLGRMKIFVGLIKLRKICNHPDLMYLKSGMKLIATGESYNGLLTGKPTENDLPSDFGCVTKSGKMVVVQGLLKMWNQQGHRVLLFTQSSMMLNILVKFVKSEGYTCLQLDGKNSVGGRQLLVKKFNEDESIFVFVLTTRVGGLGLNLIGANRVIIYDPDWNPSTDTQARERSWRIGQTKDVTIYRLMTIGTIEEKIYHRQIFKQFLTKRVLANPLQRRFFKENDLYELFTLGDVGPKQRSETSDIFAGTGSQVNFKKIKKAKYGEAEKNDKQEKKDEKGHKIHKSGSEKETEAISHHVKETKVRTAHADIISVHHGSKYTDSYHVKPSEEALITTDSDERRKKKKMKKKKKKKDKKEVEIEGVPVKNVEKTEVLKREKDKTEDDLTTEDDILLSLYKTAGIHSALKHDQIEHADDPDFIFVEREAERVASEAIKRLKASRQECKKNGLTVPTFTGGVWKPYTKKRFGAKNKSNAEEMSRPAAASSDGNKYDSKETAIDTNNPPAYTVSSDEDKSGNSNKKKKRKRKSIEEKIISEMKSEMRSEDAFRFSSSRPKLDLAVVIDDNKVSRKNTFKSGKESESISDIPKPIQKGNSIDVSSSTLLAMMKNRNSGMINLISSSEPSSTCGSGSSEDNLAKDIQDYLAQRMDASATSDEITSFFQSRLKPGEHVVFKQLLKRFCTLSNSVWKLRSEFL